MSAVPHHVSASQRILFVCLFISVIWMAVKMESVRCWFSVSCVCVLVAKAIKGGRSFRVFILSPTAWPSYPLSSSVLIRPVSFKVAAMLRGILILQTMQQDCPERSSLFIVKTWGFTTFSRFPLFPEFAKIQKVRFLWAFNSKTKTVETADFTFSRYNSCKRERTINIFLAFMTCFCWIVFMAEIPNWTLSICVCECRRRFGTSIRCLTRLAS